MAINQLNGTKQSRLQHITTTHSPVHQTDTHYSYSILGESAAIHYGINSIKETC